MDLHQRLAYLLKEKQVSQRDLAQQTGYVESTVSKWVNGSLVPSIDALMTLCSVLEISSDWLLWGAENHRDVVSSKAAPQWEVVDTTFSTTSTSFDTFIDRSQSLFFTSVWLTRAFDANNPALHRLIQQGITMRFVFPQLHISLTKHNTNGIESPELSERKKLSILHSIYQIKEWQKYCPVEVRLTPALPVNNVLIRDYHLDSGKVLYIPYIYGDFEEGIRPGFIIDQDQHPQWYAQFHQRYAIQLWESAIPVDDFEALIQAIKFHSEP